MRMNRHSVMRLPVLLLVIAASTGLATSTGLAAPALAGDSMPPATVASHESETVDVSVPPGDASLVLVAETSLHDAATSATRQAAAGSATWEGISSHSVVRDGPTEPPGKLQEWVAVETHLLDDLRGGFDTSLHLTLSFGIERAVYLNGALVTTTSFNLPAMRGSGIDAGSANNSVPASLPPSSVAILQNGPGNNFSTGASSLPIAGTVIQNTLNNQSIQSLTTINASANSLQLLRANTFQNLLKDSISHGIGLH